MRLCWTALIGSTSLAAALPAIVLLTASTAIATVPTSSPSHKCKQVRISASGSYNKCLMEAEKIFLGQRGLCSISVDNCTADSQCPAGETCNKSTAQLELKRAVCLSYFEKKWEASEAKAIVKGDPCPAEPSLEAARETVETDVAFLIAGITNGEQPTTCGNNVLEDGEVCDLQQMDGATCANLGYEAGVVSCATDCLSVNTGGCWDESTRFEDQGNGTIYDRKTQLLWEKKDNSGGIHDYLKVYAPCAGVPRVDGTGTAYTDLIEPMNAAAFGGCSEWRIPELDEFYSIIVPDEPAPHMPAAFNTGCPCTDLTSPSCSCSPNREYHTNSVLGSENSTPNPTVSVVTARFQNCGNGAAVRVVCGPVSLP